MKTPQVPAMPGMSPLGFRRPAPHDAHVRAYRYVTAIVPLNPIAQDQKTVAERQWQKQCDIGLFSDDSKQKELF